MSHNPEHHIEEAEHASHAAHNPFDKRVTITIAVVAALLACVTLLSHRAHNETLQLELASNDALTEAANEWNYFQAKKNRQYLYESMVKLTGVLAKEANASEKASEHIAGWTKEAERYKEEAEKIQHKAKELQDESKKHKTDSILIHHRGNRYDLGELCVEIGLVLCSLAVLTKKPGFWISGMTAAGLGAIIALTGFLSIGLH
jgi:hypothetical protein